MKGYSKKEIVDIVECALRKLYDKDRFLIEQQINEPCICHKFAEYLQEHFYEYNVDCVYNRHGKLVKEADGISYERGSKTDFIYPDILVHVRGNDERNILAVEAKKKYYDKKDDYAKLRFLTDKNKGYDYKLGLFIRFLRGGPKFIWFESGVELE